MDNIVVRSVKREDGPKIVEWFKSQGIDTRHYEGVFSVERGDKAIYYGVVNGRFDNYSLEGLRSRIIHDLKSNITVLSVEQMYSYSFKSKPEPSSDSSLKSKLIFVKSRIN